MTPERRQHQRKKPVQLEYVELGTDNGGMLKDVSPNGLGFLVVTPVKRGDSFRFSFSKERNDQLAGQGIVAWTDETRKAGGLQFTDVSEQFRGNLRRWFASQDSSSSTERNLPIPSIPLNDVNSPLRTTAVDEAPRRPVTPNLQSSTVARSTVDHAGVEHATGEPVRSEREKQPSASPEASTKTQYDPWTAILGLQSAETLSPELSSPAATAVSGFKTLGPSLVGYAGHESWRSTTRGKVIISVLVVAAALAASIFYRQAVGYSLIWLGQQVAGETSGGPLPDRPRTPPLLDLPTSDSSAVQSSTAAPSTTAPQSTPDPNIHEGQTGTEATTLPPSTPAIKTPPINADSATKHSDPSLSPNLGGHVREGRDINSLWAAVGQGSVDAELALGMRYLTGEQIPKNCDQARILLTAAAKKGSIEARRALEQLPQNGCR